MIFNDLSPKRREILINHMISEFGATETEVRLECEQMSEDDLAIHLEAAEFGYI